MRIGRCILSFILLFTSLNRNVLDLHSLGLLIVGFLRPPVQISIKPNHKHFVPLTLIATQYKSIEKLKKLRNCRELPAAEDCQLSQSSVFFLLAPWLTLPIPSFPFIGWVACCMVAAFEKQQLLTQPFGPALVCLSAKHLYFGQDAPYGGGMVRWCGEEYWYNAIR